MAAELAIADRLAPGPLTAGELARETDSDGRALDRVLRALASVGVFIEGKDGRFALTPSGGSSADRGGGIAEGFRDHSGRERTEE